MSVLSLTLFTAGAEAATYYVQPDNTSNIGIDGTCNVASGQITTAPTVRTTFDAVGNGATASSYRPTTGMSNGTWTVMMKVYGPVYSANAVDISAVTTAKFSIRGYNATDQWTFHLYDYDPAGAAGNKTLVATSQTITSGTGATVAVAPTYTINGTGRVQQNHRLLLEIAYMPGGTTYTPRIYYDTTGATSESLITVTENPVASGNTLTASVNTAITAVNPIDGTTGILMQRFQVDSDNFDDGQIELTSLNLADNGNATSIRDAKVYISATSSATLPGDAVLTGNTSVWDGTATVVALNGGTAADRTVSTGTPKFIYIVYDLAAGQTANTIQSSVTGVGVATPDTGAGNVGTSNLLTIQPCSDPTSSTITIPASQTAYGDPYDVSGMYSTTGNVGSLQYKVTTGSGTSTITQQSIWAQQYANTAFPNGTVNANYTIGAGSNRLLIVAISSTTTANSTQTVTVSYGGQGLTLAAGDAGTSRWNHSYLYYLDEAGITAATGTNLNVTVSGGTSYYNYVYTAAYSGVDQSAPISNARNFNSSTADAAVGPFNPTLTVNANEQAVEIINLARSAAGTTARTISTFATGWTTAGIAQTYNAVNGPTVSLYIRDRAVPSTLTNDGSQHTSGSTSTYDSMTALSMHPAPGEIICADWTSNSSIPASGTACDPYTTTPDNYNLYVRGTDPDCGTSIISSPASQAFTWNSDGTAPSVTAFTATSPSTSLNIPITSFTASDNTAVTGYNITTSATPPLAGDAGWTGTAPATFAVASDGTYTLYPWAKDSAGNVSAVYATPVTVVVDTTAPTVSTTIPANGTTGIVLNNSVTINWSENVNCSTVNTTNITSTSPGWTLSTCSNNQAVFTTSGQAYSTTYSVTVTTAIADTNGNPMAANYSFSYTTLSAPDLTAPSSAVTIPANGAVLNSASGDPFTISGTAADNVAVSGIEVSTNGGSIWNAAACTGCPGANVTWTYSWTLPADGSYTIRSRATDSSSNVETPGAGNTVLIDRTAPSVISTVPVNGATGVALNSTVTINWDENVDCASVNTTNITSTSPGWTLSACSNNQAVFTTSGQASVTTYSVTASTAVTDANGNAMASPYAFSYTTADAGAPSSAITGPANGAILNSASSDPYTVSGSATDNVAVSGIEVSTNAGTTWNAAACTGCPGTNVTWTYSWTLPADGSYTIRSRATDSSSNVETPAAGNTVLIDRTAPSVISTVPVNGATGVALNSTVTINWDENVDCASVNTTNITISSGGFTLSNCSGNQAVFTTGGQSGLTTYTVTASTSVTDANGNAMPLNYSFSYTTADASAPSSAITGPANSAILNSASSDPYTISGSATDNAAVTDIEVSTNGGTTWNAATCTGCPGANVTWTFSWTLPADGSYTIKSRATDSSSNVETPGAGNTVSIDRTAPAVSSTLPSNGASGVALNSNVTINWSENVDCATVNTINIISTSPGWTLSTCLNTQAVFTTSGQTNATAYSITVTTAVRDANSNPMTSNYSFSFTTVDTAAPSSAVSVPANGAALNSSSANPFTVSGSATDNVTVSGIEVSTNGGTTWNPATCTGCPGANVTWSYSWTLPADGSYAIRSRATDSSSNIETPGTGNTVSIDRTAPSVSSTIPANGATDITSNSDVTITWSENVNCATVNTTNITINAGGLTLSTCSANQAVFTISGQGSATTYNVTVTTGVNDANNNPMAANYSFSYTTVDTTSPSVTAFTTTSPSTSLNIPVTSFTANDNAGVTGYKITTSATPPLAGDAGWTATAPSTFTVASDGTYTLYPWAKDTSGNVSAVFATPVTVIVDTTAPSVSSTIPANSATGVTLNSNVTITWSENVDCATVNTINITSTSPGWTLSTCSNNQAVFTTSGQASITSYSVTVSTAVTDANGNAMSSPYAFSFTTADAGAPSSVITNPANGAILDSASSDPYTISGSATDNAAVTGIEVSTNGGTTWNAVTCTGCPGANVTWTYSWTLPADGSYTIRSRATDSSSNVETPGAGNAVTVDRTAPAVSLTIPSNGATGVALNSNVTITWSENVNCSTVNTVNITSTSPGWTLSTCSGNQAVFTTSMQNGSTAYSVAVTTAVTDANGNPMSANYSFSYTTADTAKPTSVITSPANGATINGSSANPFTVSGSATDNTAVTGIEVSTNGGATWNAATCAGCPGANVTWTYSWTLPADGSYNLKSRATDSSNNVETLGAGNTVTIDRTAPAVNSTLPANGATGVTVNSNVTITWSENVSCATVNTLNITSTSPGWALSTCSGNQAVFITSGQSGMTAYSVTVTTGVTDANSNAMTANYSFSYTTGDVGIPASTITAPANGATINSTSANPYAISGSATDNIAVSGIEVSTNGGTTWNAATCTGCPGANVTWSYSWTLPADGSYTIRSRATDSSSNVEAPAAGNTVTIDRTAPSVSSTVPVNGATNISLNSPVTITWSENVNCATVNTTNVTINGGGWTLSACSGNQAVFTTSAQAGSTTYTVTATTGISDSAGNSMSTNYLFSYTTSDVTTPAVTSFTAASPSASLNIPVTAFTASDNVSVTGFKITTSATPPLAGDAGWTAIAPSTFTVASDGTYTLYPWAKDAAGNVSAVFATPRTVVVDTTAPTVTNSVPASSATGISLNSTVTINWSENVDCTTVTTATVTISPAVGWTRTSCSAAQAVFTPSGQSSVTSYTVTVTTGIRDANGNAMTANYLFSYTTADVIAPSSTITAPSNGTIINSASPNPYAISGSATDNVSVTGIEVSTNGGTTWNAATCTGCPGTNVTWTYSWTLPADGSYNIRSRATDVSTNVETPGAGNTVTVDRTAPSVSGTNPANGATAISLDSNVTIIWSESVSCASVNTTNITSTSPGWTLSSCLNNQAVFATSGQAGLTTYTVTVTTGVTDTNNNPMSASTPFTFTTADVTPPSSVITAPSNGSTINGSSPNPYSISGSANDNLAVSGIEVSTNGGATWNPATCTGCPGANVTWTYSWTLPADGSYTIRSRAKDTSNNTETPGAGNTVSIDRTAPSVSITVPANGATNVILNSSVTITWAENVNCTTVNTTSVTSTNPGWTLLTCSGNQAVFTTSGQSGPTNYIVTVTTGVMDTIGNAMAADYSFSYTTETPPNGTPSDPAGLAQFKSDETTAISHGRWSNENIVVMKGTVTDPDGDLVQLQVEIQAGASAFTGTPNCTSGPAVASNSIAKAVCSGLTNGTQYKWQARTIDTFNTTSGWTQYGGTDPDVSVDTVAPAYTWNTPASGAYYKNGSAISVDVTIAESGSGLLNGTDCGAKIDGESTSFTGLVLYFPATGKCTGTLTLNNPSGLINGVHNLTIQAPDIAGNSTQSTVRSINIDNNVPVSAVTAPANGAVINGSSPNPHTISGTASDNSVVSRVEVSTNGGTTWDTAVCTGCGTNSAAWTYSWTLPSDGSYTIKSRAVDSANNIETPGTGSSVTVDKTAPSVSVTQPANAAAGTALNGNVTITWNENVNCTTVTTANVTISSGGWVVSGCSGNQAVFTTGSQTYLTSYTVTVRTAVKDLAGNSMAANYIFSFTTTGMNIPVLSYPSSPYDNGLDPDAGDTRTTFTFRVIYRDYENDAPASGYPMIFIGDNDGYYGYSMTAENPLDTNYADGKTYYFTTGFGAAQDLRYFFEAQAAAGDISVVNLPAAAPGYNAGPAVNLLAGYNLVGVPKNLSCNCNTYTSVLSDDSGYQYCLSWDSYGPDPAGGGWMDNTYGMLYSGRGYEIYSDGGARRLDEPAGASPMGNDPSPYVDINLDGNGGWTVITNPYNSFIELRDVMVVRSGIEYSYTQAVVNGWISNSIYEWEGDGPGYAFKAFNGSQPAVLEPWVGYFIHVFDAAPTALRIYAP